MTGLERKADVVSVTGLSHTSLMERSASKEIGRGLLVTFAASLSGPMLGVITFGLNPIGGLSLVPFTAFGSFVLLLPVYLWFKTSYPANLGKVYVRVTAAGLLGGIALTALLFGSPARWLGTAALQLYVLGGAIGLSTAIVWVAAHRLTAGIQQAPDGL